MILLTLLFQTTHKTKYEIRLSHRRFRPLRWQTRRISLLRYGTYYREGALPLEVIIVSVIVINYIVELNTPSGDLRGSSLWKEM